MIETSSLIVPFFGALIMGLFAILWWAGKKWIEKNDQNTVEVLKLLNLIRDDIDAMKIDIRLVSNHVQEVEGRFEMRLQGLRQELSENRTRIIEVEKRQNTIERDHHTFKILHRKNHPNDEFIKE